MYIRHILTFKGFLYSLHSSRIDKEELIAVKSYINDLREFYIEKDLGSFFKKNQEFINGGIKEFQNNTPKNYINIMEKYYGEKFQEFAIYPNPFDAFPLNEGDEDFFHGNGQRIETKNGVIASMMTSAFLPIDFKKQSNKYGFDHPDYVKFIVTHEFGHSFVNHTLKKVASQLNATEKLFSSELSKKMKPQGYQNWSICMAEHLVRLGEIRIAEINGEKQRAEKLREMHIKEFSFVLIPVLEKKISEYEQNRDKYLTYQDFLPELLSVLNEITPQEVRELLNHSATTPKAKITKEN